MNNVIWTSNNEYWDQTLLRELLKDCNNYQAYFPDTVKEAIVVIPGAYLGKEIDLINRDLQKLDRCKVIITSDEENNFPIDELEHPNMEVYATYMCDKYHRDIKWLPIGPARLPKIPYKPKELDFFFAGQVNHDSRRKLVEVLKTINNGEILATDGFAQGYDHDEYYERMAKARTVPAPRGNISPDSFRFYEALEVGAVPIADNVEWWVKLFPDNPINFIDTWDNYANWMRLPVIDQEYRNQCVAWWQRKKLEIKDELIGAPDTTVVIPVSPILSHPSTEIIDETIKSVQGQLPTARIIVTFDGVRNEQNAKTSDYNEFIERFLRKYNGEVYPMIFEEHTHQVGMMRETMKHCGKYIVYVEQDTPFTDDWIDWQGCKDSLKKVDLIRFHFEASIPEPHKHLMMGELTSYVSLMLTTQWSQRPHITTKSFYERVLENFSPEANSFIEDKMHSVAQQYPEDYRLAIYYPEGNIKRSTHTDGRAGEEKYDGSQIF